MMLWLIPPRPSVRTSLMRPITPPSCGDAVVGCGCRTTGGDQIGAPLETDPANGGRRIALWRDHRRIAIERAVRVPRAPVQAAPRDLVHEGQEEDHREDDDRPETELA